MKVICAWCQAEGQPANLGEREPFDDPGTTHGMCRRHRAALSATLPAKSFPGARVLVVIDPHDQQLYEYLKPTCGKIPDIALILERRRADRRRERHDVAHDRRFGDRRTRWPIVSALGYSLVRFGRRPAVPTSGG